MKKIISLSFLIIALVLPSISSATAPCDDDKKLSWDSNFERYCSDVWACENYNPTNKWENILKIQKIPFDRVFKDWAMEVAPNAAAAAVDNALSEKDSSFEDYNTYLTKLWLVNLPYIGTKPLEKAKSIYLETQNAVYNCAVLEAKLKVGKNIIKFIKDKDWSNIKSAIESQNKNIETEISKRNCNSLWNSDVSYREALLDNVTYHYCNYRFYLNYLANFPEYNMMNSSISSAAKRPSQANKEAAALSKNTTKQTGAVIKEIAHSKEVYNLSFSAFSEFENTYWLHVMLLFILDDYQKYKENLWKVLNPISQLVYKIPQAQCQSGCK
jgi:hypothetical protein